jgi:hypothetical protein
VLLKQELRGSSTPVDRQVEGSPLKLDKDQNMTDEFSGCLLLHNSNAVVLMSRPLPAAGRS